LFCLNSVSVAFESNDIIGLAGANGSGKTTLIRILIRQLVDYKGNYSIDNRTIDDISANLCSSYKIGYAPDDAILDDTLTGYEILQLVAQLRGISADRFEEEFRLFKNYLHLDEWFSSQQCGEYSHGMRKKVSIALAYLGDMKFVILDEPLNGLDPVAVFGLQQLITYKKGRGTGALISSHILDFIEKNSAVVALMKKGEVIYSGDIEKLYQHYAGYKLDEIYFKLFMKE